MVTAVRRVGGELECTYVGRALGLCKYERLQVSCMYIFNVSAEGRHYQSCNIPYLLIIMPSPSC